MLVALALFAGAALKTLWDGAFDVATHPARAVAAGLPVAVSARVVKVVDGDTFRARIEISPDFRVSTRVRLRGVDAPEMRASCEEERIGAKAARRALRAILAEGGVIIRDLGEDRYGRLLGTVTTRATPDVSEALIAKGVARRYEGGRRESWC